MYTFLLITFLLLAIFLIVLVLLQPGKGAEAGGLTASNISSTLFGSSGAGNFLTRLTAIIAILFFVVSLVLANLNANRDNDRKWLDLTQKNSETEQKALIEKEAEVKTTINDIPK